MTSLSHIPAVISEARRELVEAERDAWLRFTTRLECAIDEWGEENVRGAVDEIMRIRAEVEEAKRAQEAQAEYEREMKHKPQLSRYEYTLPE